MMIRPRACGGSGIGPAAGADDAAQARHQRRGKQRQAHGQQHARAQAGFHQPGGDSVADDDEGKFAALSQQ
jgi:hypothetical protein